MTRIGFQWQDRVVKSCKHGKRACGTKMMRLRNHERRNSCTKRRKKFPNKSCSLKKVVSMRFPQCFRLYEVASTLQAQSSSLSISEIASKMPHKNEAVSQQCGCHTNNEAASQQWGCLITMRIPPNNEATSQQWGNLITPRLPHTLKAMRLPHINVASSQ